MRVMRARPDATKERALREEIEGTAATLRTFEPQHGKIVGCYGKALAAERKHGSAGNHTAERVEQRAQRRHQRAGRDESGKDNGPQAEAQHAVQQEAAEKAQPTVDVAVHRVQPDRILRQGNTHRLLLGGTRKHSCTAEAEGARARPRVAGRDGGRERG